MSEADHYYESLFQIAKLLLAEEEDERAPEILLRRVLEATSAKRGFIVLRVGEAFEEKCNVEFSGEALSKEERRFSRSLVRRAIETKEVLYSPNLAKDPRFLGAQSALLSGEEAVIAAPLVAREEVYGALYIVGSFSDKTKRFLSEISELSGLFLKRAIEQENLKSRTQSLERDLFAKFNFQGIVTQHPTMLRLLETIGQISGSDVTVLIRGETGTGKELIARALHVNSARNKKPYTTLHCTALPSSMLEGELFGHEKGAFTGADKRREGRLAAAHGGTLFLDEIGEIPLDIQAKLLRFLQFGEIQRLGSDKTERIDVRVICATHRDLDALIKEGKFRQDLYFRLKVIELNLPPLRERKSDLPLLISHCLRASWRRTGEEPALSARAQAALLAYDFPGNIRELSHQIERACLLAQGPQLDLDLFPAEIQKITATPKPNLEVLSNEALQAAREAAIQEVEKSFIEALMQKAEGNVSAAARIAGMQRSYLQKLLARYRDV
jgi:transcriptional regulator with GAF, ATPase, and Fis domain